MMHRRPEKMSLKIPPLKRSVMDLQLAEKTWEILEVAIQEIYINDASRMSFEELYRNAYKMVYHNYGEKLYSGLVITTTQHLRKVAKTVESAQGGLFLGELNHKWLAHNNSLHMIRKILMYMERTYLAAHDHAPVFEVGLILWKDKILRSSKIWTRLLSSVLDLIHRERTGGIINRGLMRSITQMFMNLGPSVYEAFEWPFLDAATDFYRLESQQLLETSHCADYLKQVERRLNEEMERVIHFLDVQTELKIIAVVKKEMISYHMKLLVEMESSGLVSMLVNDKYEDLARMYNLFGRVTNGLQVVREAMVSHVRLTGKQLVMDPTLVKDPVEFVQRLLDEKDKYDNIIHISFDNDRTFQSALESSFQYFINVNVRSPEFISLFVDDKFRKGLKGISEENVETLLDKVITLFHYLQEKDVFEKYYKKHLAKRLLSGRTVCDDAERSMILKLKTKCGNLFTAKLEGMFTDMKISRDTMRRFNATLSSTESSEGPTLVVQVLTTGSWPTQESGARCHLPTEVRTACDKFTAYYLSTHTGRRLRWQTNMGSADLKVTFGNGLKHELSVSTHQMCVLLLFTTADRLHYREIEQATDIPCQDLKRILQSLACVRGKNVLRKEPMSKDINDADVFVFNENFVSKSYRVKISIVAAQKENETEKQETRKKVDEDRKPQIDAAVVRIMKSRRVLDHKSIISEVTNLLQARFLPHPTVIKRCIESLIERDFLERDQTDGRQYRYLA